MKPLATAIKESWRYLEARVDDTVALATGLTTLDRVTEGGLRMAAVTLLVGDADTVRGLATAISTRVASVAPLPAGLFSLDRQTETLGLRFLSMHAGIALGSLKPGRTLPEAQWAVLMKAADELSKLPIFVDDAPLTTIESLRSRILEAVRAHDLRLVVVEGLDGLAEDGGVPLAEVCATLHDVAQKARCTVLASTPDTNTTTKPKRGHAAPGAARLARHVDAVWSLERSADDVTVRVVKGPGMTRSARLMFDQATGRIEDPPPKPGPKGRQRRRAGSLALDLGKDRPD